MSNKPTHYLVQYGNFLNNLANFTNSTKLKKYRENARGGKFDKKSATTWWVLTWP